MNVNYFIKGKISILKLKLLSDIKMCHSFLDGLKKKVSHID